VAAWDHPLYIILGHILVLIFHSADSLWIANLVSALSGAGAVAMLFIIAYNYTESIWVSCYISFSLAVAHTFWWHSSTPEVYTLFVFLLLVSFHFFDQFERTGRTSLLTVSAFFLGLAASTHILAFLVLPSIVLYYFFTKSYRRFSFSILEGLVFPTFGFLAGFSIYLIQFIRMVLNSHQGGIFDLAIGSEFLNRVSTLSPLLFLTSVITYLFFLIVQFGPIGLILGAIGFRNALRTPDLSQRKFIAFFIVYALFGIFYRVTDQFTFFITSHVFWAILMGLGSISTLKLIPEKRRLLLPILLAAQILITPFVYNALPQLADKYGINDAALQIPNVGVGIRNGLAYYMNPYKRGDFTARDFGQGTLAKLEPDSIVIAEWYTDTDEYFILRYFTKIKGQRTDVEVFGWPTQDPFTFDSQLVLDLITSNIDQRPIYLASLSDKFYAASKLISLYCIAPENNLYRLYPKQIGSVKCLGSDLVTP